MKIELINDNQIRCILTRADLEARQIKLSELAYGSEKAKSLFKEMMHFAYDKYGFDIEDIPLMIEAVPLSSDAIVLIVTKIGYPDELDSRFANFSDTEEDENSFFEESSANNKIPSLNNHGITSKKANEILEESRESDSDIYRIYKLDSIDDAINIAHLLNGIYRGNNSLFKDNNKYYLLMYMSEHTPNEFNKICNTISEYAPLVDSQAQSVYHLHEHGTVICKDNALTDLSNL